MYKLWVIVIINFTLQSFITHLFWFAPKIIIKSDCRVYHFKLCRWVEARHRLAWNYDRFSENENWFERSPAIMQRPCNCINSQFHVLAQVHCYMLMLFENFILQRFNKYCWYIGSLLQIRNKFNSYQNNNHAFIFSKRRQNEN